MQQQSRGYNANTVNQHLSFKDRLVAKIKWLFTKEGRPSLLVIIIGFIVGAFVDGAVGIILSTIIGLAVLTFLKKFHLPTKPWQATVTTLFPIIARLCFMMILLLPVADASVGLLLPSGHNPDTLMKYLSIMVVVPKNIVSNAPITDPFPGIPIIVALSVILMFWGSLNLYKRKNFAIALSGLVLYTISPTIASAVTPGHFNQVSSYAVGYYLGWVGLVLIVVDKFFLHRILKTPAPMSPNPTIQNANRFMSIFPVFTVALLFSQLQTLHIHLPMITLQIDQSAGFEEAHHAFASVFTGAVAAIGAAVVIEGATSSDDSSSSDDSGPTEPTSSPEIPPTPPEVPTAPPTPPDAPPNPPQPDTTSETPAPPEAPPESTTPGPHVGDTHQYTDEFGNQQTLILQPDGTWVRDSDGHTVDIDKLNDYLKQAKADQDFMNKDQQHQIDTDKTKAASDDKALHDSLEAAHDDTKKFWKDYYTQENEFNSWEAEHEIQKAEGYEKLEKVAEITKKGADTLIFIGKYTVPGGRQVADIYEVTTEIAEGAADGKPGEGLAKGTIKAGEKILEHVIFHKLEHALGHESDAGKIVHYLNSEKGSLPENFIKDKIKGAGPEKLGEIIKEKTGLEHSEGGPEHSEGGLENTESGAPSE